MLYNSILGKPEGIHCQVKKTVFWYCKCAAYDKIFWSSLWGTVSYARMHNLEEKLAEAGVYLGEKIESTFWHFAKFSIRKMDSSQDSIWEKWSLHMRKSLFIKFIWEKQSFHKIQYEKNSLFTKFSMRKIVCWQNSVWEEWTFNKIQCEKNRLFTKFNVGKTDFSQNSLHRYESFPHKYIEKL